MEIRRHITARMEPHRVALYAYLDPGKSKLWVSEDCSVS